MFDTQKLIGIKNLKSLLISIPKYIELNSELILVLGFGLGPHPGPRPNIYTFWGEKSDLVSKLSNVKYQIKIQLVTISMSNYTCEF